MAERVDPWACPATALAAYVLALRRAEEDGDAAWPRNCERCDGAGEICTKRGETVEDDEFTLCPDCDGSGMARA